MADNEHQHHPSYGKIYIALVVLLTISVVGNYSGIIWVTLIIAFGVALLKANLVVQNFMHLKIERPLARWLLTTALMVIALLLAGVSPDIMAHHGVNWVNNAAQEEIARGIPFNPEEARKPVPPVPFTAPGAKTPFHTKADGATPGGVDPTGSTARMDGSSSKSGAKPAVAMASMVPLPGGQHFDAKETFNSTCATCHGKDGSGNGPAAAALTPKPADFRSPAFWNANPDSVLLKAIKDGGASVGKAAVMPAWGGSFSNADIHALLDYIRTAFAPKADKDK